MTTSTAGNLAEHAEKDKDKVEKRRALGRGLESLLPRPRVVAGTAVVPGQGSGTVGGQQIPPSGRNDKSSEGRSDDAPPVSVTAGAEAPLTKEAADAAPT